MITLPSFLILAHARLYHDSGDAELVYVDLLQPGPAKGDSAMRWMPIPDSLAYLVGEVRFGPGQEGFGPMPPLVEGQRLLPMPWEIVPVLAWYRESNGVQVVARGKTSGFGPSNAVFSGTAPLSAMVSPVLISAELMCIARLARARVSGGGAVGAVEAALPEAALGERAAWDATLGGVLIDTLSRLLDGGHLTLQLDADCPQLERHPALLAELRELALLEWAHRLQVLIAPELSLAAPAALVKSTALLAPLSLHLAWVTGANVMLRAVRVLRPIERDHAVPDI